MDNSVTRILLLDVTTSEELWCRTEGKQEPSAQRLNGANVQETKKAKQSHRSGVLHCKTWK